MRFSPCLFILCNLSMNTATHSHFFFLNFTITIEGFRAMMGDLRPAVSTCGQRALPHERQETSNAESHHVELQVRDFPIRSIRLSKEFDLFAWNSYFVGILIHVERNPHRDHGAEAERAQGSVTGSIISSGQAT